MFQPIASSPYPSCFSSALPVLAYTWEKKADETFSPPRIMHRHSDLTELILITSGSVNYTAGEHQYHVKEGDMVVLNAGILHDEDARLGTATTVVGIAFSGIRRPNLPENALLPQDDSPILTLGQDYVPVRETINTIHTLLSRDNVRYGEACQLMGCGLVSMLIRLLERNAVRDPDAGKKELLTERIRGYIDDHFREDLTLLSISNALHVNRYYLAHVFKENSGYSPMQYMTRLRLGKAQELLSQTRYPITEIAGMVGYDNPCHFNAMFTKYIGMSPGKYRKTCRPSSSGK